MPSLTVGLLRCFQASRSEPGNNNGTTDSLERESNEIRVD